MVIEYLKLQIQLNFRKIKDSGFNPWLVLCLFIAGFAAFTTYLFTQTEYAAPIYVALALSVIAKLSEEKRNEFFKINFGNRKTKIIRITENTIITLPFIAVLLVKSHFFPAAFLLGFAVLYAFYIFQSKYTFVLPTPFSKNPFEFAIGFRNTFPLLILAYGLIPLAVKFSNFNYGIFALVITFVITMGYYNKPEDEYYVWNSNRSAAQFLFEKIKTALFHSSILAAPLGILLTYLFPENIIIIGAFILIGWAFLIAMILGKYASYPDELNISIGVFIALCISFPPLLLVVIPYLFQKSKTRLSALLK